jgi:hypothetical protein
MEAPLRSLRRDLAAAVFRRLGKPLGPDVRSRIDLDTPFARIEHWRAGDRETPASQRWWSRLWHWLRGAAH